MRRHLLALSCLPLLLASACTDAASDTVVAMPRTIVGTWSLATPDPNFTGSYKLSYKETLDGNDTFGTMALHTDVAYTATATVFAGCKERLDYPGTFQTTTG